MAYQKAKAVTVPFPIINTDGEAVVTGTPNVYISKDGAAQASADNAASHLGNGQWAVALTATEMTADVISLFVTETGSTPTHLVLETVSTVDAIDVIDEHTHFADGGESRSIISLKQNFAGTLALVPDLVSDSAVSSVSSAALTGAASVTGSNLRKTPNGKMALYTVAALSTTGTYTATVTIVTTDSQTIVTTGTIIVE
ncbi:MAG: hypothetical protein GY896_11705 [Gammaproteobacteria bacterium]|nr:hypothetical protein [Gammaproteobacteria bacterium]